MTRAQEVAEERHPVKKAATLLGPGYITGAADDDHSVDHLAFGLINVRAATFAGCAP